MPQYFKLAKNCEEFIIDDEQSAFKWIYSVGMKYHPNFGGFYDFFKKAIDTQKICIGKFITSFKSGTIPSTDDVLFYVLLQRYFYLGLLQTSYVPFNLLNHHFKNLVQFVTLKYGIKPGTIPALAPAKQPWISPKAPKMPSPVDYGPWTP